LKSGNKKINSFIDSIRASLDNAERLLYDAESLYIEDSAPSVYALSIIAQEEFAKAFILHLVSLECIPWDSETWKMLRNHACKQLFTLIMDFLNPDFDEFIERIDKDRENIARGTIRPTFPSHIADAINIIRHEKATKNGYRNQWLNINDPQCDKVARMIGDGNIDKLKQNALYVNIGKTGQVINTPSLVKPNLAMAELAKTRRIRKTLYYKEGKLLGPIGLDFEKLSAAFKLVFNIITFEGNASS